jgi:hypothetical protein
MRKWFYRGLVARGLIGRTLIGRTLIGRTLIRLACLVPAGCSDQVGSIQPADALALLSTGRPVLGCRQPCLAEWQRAQPQAAQLDAGRRSQDLAVLVMRIGYQDDLSLYYLGRAAEGLGYRGAAASYYRQSMQLSGTSISCQVLSRQCGGVVLPSAAAVRVAAIDRLSRPPRPRRTGPAPQEPEAPEPPEAAAGAVETPVPSPTSSPASIPGAPAAFEYIEPPPAVR